MKSSTNAIKFGNKTNALDKMEEIIAKSQMTEASMLNTTSKDTTENNNHTLKTSSPMSIERENIKDISYVSNSSTNNNSSETNLKHSNITALKSNIRRKLFRQIEQKFS